MLVCFVLLVFMNTSYGKQFVFLLDILDIKCLNKNKSAFWYCKIKNMLISYIFRQISQQMHTFSTHQQA